MFSDCFDSTYIYGNEKNHNIYRSEEAADKMNFESGVKINNDIAVACPPVKDCEL